MNSPLWGKVGFGLGNFMFFESSTIYFIGSFFFADFLDLRSSFNFRYLPVHIGHRAPVVSP